MWGAGPVAQGAVRQAAPSPESRPPSGGSTPDPLEAYFDHLDAAFASGTIPGADPAAPPAAPVRREPIPISRMPAPSPQPAPRVASGDPFADWDPDLAGDPSRPAPPDAPLAFPTRPAAPPAQAQEPPVTHVTKPPAAPPPVAPPAAAAPPPAAPARVAPPSLVDAFAALLAAEQRIGLSPSAATTAPPSPSGSGSPAAPALTDELVETVTARVVARLTDQSKHTILDAAERLVREEIERIKANQ
jgi:hypothetical protein